MPIGDNVEAAYAEGVCGIVSINRVADLPTARKRSKSDMALIVNNLIRMYRTFCGSHKEGIK